MTSAATSPTANELAQRRTDLAAWRTLMARVRTALSLESFFGITIYKVLQAFLEEGRALPRDQTPANVMGVLLFFGITTKVL